MERVKQGRDSAAIKLFGKRITVPENGFSSEESAGCFGYEGGRSDQYLSLAIGDCLEDEKNPVAGNPTGSKQDKPTPPTTEEPPNSESLLDSDKNPKTLSDEETEITKPSKIDNDQCDTKIPEQKPLKKPDKILSCPRCNSIDTKFCYYNNCNISQPRHFCKSCQRYWTAGGTMRNMPIGAGRRKNKSSASHCHHITISEAFHSAQIHDPNGIHYPTSKTNGRVLSFGPEPPSPLCESKPCFLGLAEKKSPNGTGSGFYKVEQGIAAACNCGENGDDSSSGSSVITSNTVEDGVRNGLQQPILNGFSSHIPCFYWNSSVPIPAFYPSEFPMPFYPAPYWNYSAPSAWSVPWLSPTTNQKEPNSTTNSPTLGKHSRDGDLLKPSNIVEKEPLKHKKSERSNLIPKTLRIDDPDEVARSSIWATLGIKNDSIGRKSLFKAFQRPKGVEEKNHIAEATPSLRANPAALSRFLIFQEGA